MNFARSRVATLRRCAAGSCAMNVSLAAAVLCALFLRRLPRTRRPTAEKAPRCKNPCSVAYYHARARPGQMECRRGRRTGCAVFNCKPLSCTAPNDRGIHRAEGPADAARSGGAGAAARTSNLPKSIRADRRGAIAVMTGQCRKDRNAGLEHGDAEKLTVRAQRDQDQPGPRRRLCRDRDHVRRPGHRPRRSRNRRVAIWRKIR